MLPEDFIKRIKLQPYIDLASLSEALEKPAPVSIRLNPAKWSGKLPQEEVVPWEPLGFYLETRPQYTLDPFFHAGVYYPQEASGMFTGEVFRQLSAGRKELRILDLCAAPGGKSTHLSALLGDNGFLVANEVIRSRASVLAENITKWGTGNVIVTQNDPADFKELEGFFDMIFIDAPCSGEGMFNDREALKEWSVANTQLCSERQKRILVNAWHALKPGGFLIYSTCTFNPAENEENIAWLNDGMKALPVRIDISGYHGIAEINLRGITGYGFHPGRIRGDGFFISVLMKEGAKREFLPGRKSRSSKSPSKLHPEIKEMISADEDKLSFFDSRIIMLAAGNDLHDYIADRLNIIKSGTMIGEVKNNSFIPAHDLAMSVKLRRSYWLEYEVSYDEAMAFLRHDSLRLREGRTGRLILSYREIPLGFVNNLGNRVNNGYPQPWRVRMEKKDIFRPVL